MPLQVTLFASNTASLNEMLYYKVKKDTFLWGRGCVAPKYIFFIYSQVGKVQGLGKEVVLGSWSHQLPVLRYILIFLCQQMYIHYESWLRVLWPWSESPLEFRRAAEGILKGSCLPAGCYRLERAGLSFQAGSRYSSCSVGSGRQVRKGNAG